VFTTTSFCVHSNIIATRAQCLCSISTLVVQYDPLVTKKIPSLVRFDGVMPVALQASFTLRQEGGL
jgi:hypothetical protein